MVTMAGPGSWKPRRPSNAYARTFSALAAGAYLLVTGLIGLDVSHLRGFFAGTRWVGRVVWWQVAIGSALLLLGMFLARRLDDSRAWARRRARRRIVKNVGRGRAFDADPTSVPRSLEMREPDK
jgi:hypothetical protein